MALAPRQASGKAPITLTWQADDPNGDQLIYALYVKATDEQEWHLLKDKIHQASYTIDPSALADGKYVARLVASDEESNPPNSARTSELLSAPFWVDNTPPEVRGPKANGYRLHRGGAVSRGGQHVSPAERGDLSGRTGLARCLVR